MDRDRTGRLTNLLEQESQRCTKQADQHTKAKTIHIAKERTLLLENSVENRRRLLHRAPVPGGTRKEGLNMPKLLLKIEIESIHRPSEEN